MAKDEKGAPKRNGAGAALERKFTPVTINAIDLAEYVNARFKVTTANDVEFGDLTDPRLWLYVIKTSKWVEASEMKEGDLITVQRQDRAYWAELLVVDVQPPSHIQLVVLRSVAPLPPRYGDSEARCPDGYHIVKDQHSGKYLALRISDGARMNGDGSATREMALRALLDHAVFRTAAPVERRFSV